MDYEILSYQRSILSGLMIESFVEEDNNEKLSLIEEILSLKSHLFSKIQVNILEKALTEISIVRAEGCYECWIISDAFFENLDDNEKSEFNEIISKPALIFTQIPVYLKLLQKKFFLRKVI